MTRPSIIRLIGTAAVLIATSLASAYAGDKNQLSPLASAHATALPGVAAQVDPCGPKRTTGPLGY